MDIQEPPIRREEILLLKDDVFHGGHVCIVTGAGSGIGRAAAVVAAANGLHVAAVDIHAAGCAETARIAGTLGGRVTPIQADLTNDRDLERAVEQSADLGKIKFLANIAGVQHIDSVENFPMEKYDFMQKLMLRAPFYLSKLAIPEMKRNDGGAIGNMGSVHAHICTVNKPVYSMTKFGLRALTQSIAAEGEGRIRSFSVSVGFVRTPLALGQIPAQAKQRGLSEEAVVRDVMMGRSRVKEMMRPVEVGNLFVFGFSRFARYLVGGDLLFDGGMVLTY